MSLFHEGHYKIFSVQFPGQDVDLLYGGPTAVIAGYHNNTHSDNMVWNLSNVGTSGNQFTLANTAPSANGAYIGVPQNITVGAQLHGSPTPLTWTAVGTCVAGEYILLAPASAGVNVPSGLVWSLANAEDGTPITLQPIMSLGSPQTLHARQGGTSSSYTFVPWNH